MYDDMIHCQIYSCKYYLLT